MKPFSISIEHLSKSYGDLTIWSDLNLTLKSGQVYCLMGPSGCGKTTLLRILLGLEHAESGKIRQILCDGSFREFTPVIHRDLPFTAVFQENRLCEEFSPLDNVLLATDKSCSRKQVYAELTRLLPEESLLRPVSTLSGGMKRRVAIMRALLAPSCGIVMDEPFTGLDSDTKGMVIAYIREKMEERLLLIATHQEEDAEELGANLLRPF